jgi:hypothetical protein
MGMASVKEYPTIAKILDNRFSSFPFSRQLVLMISFVIFQISKLTCLLMYYIHIVAYVYDFYVTTMS